MAEVRSSRHDRAASVSLRSRSCGVDLRDQLALGRAHHEVHLGHVGLVEAHGELDAPAAERLGQDRRHPLADGGVVAVAGQVDQAGDVAAVGVAADEQPQLAALAGEHHRLRDRDQLVDRGQEELVARVVLQHVEQLLAGVAARLDAARARAPRRPSPSAPGCAAPTRCRWPTRTARGTGAPPRPGRSRRTSSPRRSRGRPAGAPWPWSWPWPAPAVAAPWRARAPPRAASGTPRTAAGRRAGCPARSPGPR